MTEPVTRLPGPKYLDMANRLWGPQESHGIESDCPNPYCDYMLTDQDWYDIEEAGGQFTCPNCGWVANFATLSGGRQRTRSGLTLEGMGRLGEDIVKAWLLQHGEIPGIGGLVWESPGYQDPIDLVIGSYAIEVKTLHSESYPRFKIGGIEGSKNRQGIIQDKIARTKELSDLLEMPLEPAVLGVRLNFYTNRADFFFKVGLKDFMMTAMDHLGEFDFTALNPYRDPTDVPPASMLPEEGWTENDDDIPF